MKIIIRSDSVYIEGYVNAVERNSKPLNERGVEFIERIGSGAFKRALERAKDVRILLNHKPDRDLGGIKDGNLSLEEDSIGLLAKTTITDAQVVRDARNGDLVGWSFGFADTPDGVKQLRDEETGLPLRKVNDLELFEVSLLNREKSPAYVGTLVKVRDDGAEEEIKTLISSENIDDDNEVINEALNEIREDDSQPNKDLNPEAETREESPVNEVTSEAIAGYKNIIAELKAMQKF